MVYLPVVSGEVDTRKSNSKTPIPQDISTRTLKPVGTLHLQPQVYENFPQAISYVLFSKRLFAYYKYKLQTTYVKHINMTDNQITFNWCSFMD